MRHLLTFLPLLVAVSLTTKAQNIKPLLDNQNYVFIAQTSQPLAGSERRLTINSYYLKVTKDKIVSNLPYSGHISVASTDEMTGALDFTTGKFSYTVKPNKKGGWIVTIKPRDAGYVEELRLKIRPDGSAVADASFNGLDDISFAGMVADPGVLPAQ